MTPTIYRIDFPDGQFYIGATVNFPERRRTHLRYLRKRKAVNKQLQKAFDEHQVCHIYPIASGFDRDTLHELESQIIAQCNPPLNVNTKPTRIPGKYDGAAKKWGPFSCLGDAAKSIGVSYQAIKKLARRYSYEDYIALEKQEAKPKTYGPPDPRKHSHLIFIKGGWYVRKNVCKVGAEIARKRRNNGWSYDDSHLTPRGEPNPKLKNKACVPNLCRKYGVAKNVYYSRRYNGWTAYEALGLKPRTIERKTKVKQRIITAGGITLPIKKWAERLGVTAQVIHTRLSSGWSEAEAVGVARRQVDIEREAKAAAKAARKTTRETYEYKGVTGTLPELCRHFGANYARASSRRYSGLPIERWFYDKRTVAKSDVSFEELEASLGR